LTENIQAPRRSPIRRAGCIVLLVIWFGILLLPCFLIMLAVQGEITISTGGAPGQQTRLWLVSEPDERGLGISSASAIQSAPDAVCVETSVRFYLWAGSSEPSVYCECYQRENADSAWASTTTTTAACDRTG
jgi:hypothetical protein